ATSLERWLGGRAITAARGPIAVGRVIGETVEAVEARGKHVLIRLAPSQLVLHSHMRMSGSWHVYSAGDRWRRPRAEARLVLECGDRTAVCFNAPVIELLAGREEAI